MESAMHLLTAKKTSAQFLALISVSPFSLNLWFVYSLNWYLQILLARSSW